MALGDERADIDVVAELEKDGEAEGDAVCVTEIVILTVVVNEGVFVLEPSKLSVGVAEKVSFDDGIESTL